MHLHVACVFVCRQTAVSGQLATAKRRKREVVFALSDVRNLDVACRRLCRNRHVARGRWAAGSFADGDVRDP